MGLSPKQRHHLLTILEDFRTECTMKYMHGQEEHGGNLFDADRLWLVEEGMKEAIDQYVYLHTLREQLRKRRKRITSGEA